MHPDGKQYYLIMAKSITFATLVNALLRLATSFDPFLFVAIAIQLFVLFFLFTNYTWKKLAIQIWSGIVIVVSIFVLYEFVEDYLAGEEEYLYIDSASLAVFQLGVFIPMILFAGKYFQKPKPDDPAVRT